MQFQGSDDICREYKLENLVDFAGKILTIIIIIIIIIIF